MEGTRECEAHQVVLIRRFSECEPEDSDGEDDYGRPPHQHEIDRQANRCVPLETATRSLGRAADADAHTDIQSAGRIVTYNTI